MNQHNTQNWNNYWQGRNAQAGSDALVTVGIENNHTLRQFWTDAFEDIDKQSSIVDLACGAGSVLSCAVSAGFEDLKGVDVSPDALAVLKKRMPQVQTILSPVDRIELESSICDVVVSQYGIEYAGAKRLEAFQEAVRILKPQGQLIALIHVEGGAIYEECLSSSARAEVILQSRFFSIATKIIRAIHGIRPCSQAQNKKDMASLNDAVESIKVWLRKVDQEKNDFARFTMYMLEGTKGLIINHKTYDGAESVEWLRNMKMEVVAYKGRMDSMLNAAVGLAEIDHIIASIGQNDDSFAFKEPRTISFAEDAKPAAWIISGYKA